MDFSHFHNTQISVATDSGSRTASDVSHTIFDCGKSGICGRKPTSRNPSTVDRVKHTFPYKSQLCILFQRGNCYWGENCRFAHSLKEIGESGSSDVGEEALTDGRFLMDNYGRYQTKSQSIHYRPEEDRRKTKLCNKWERFGMCPYGLQCCFAHGVAELRKCNFHDDLDTKNASRFKLALEPCEIGIGTAVTEELEPRGKRRCMNWSIKKMSQIYADWIV